ncbi:DUF6691 family protein [Hydromonas duriensis]|uniref:Sulphur transport domain-containing protein n=1 Tax=Hydromonas duriensis TaxID=1527608 RepID=A0A4R6Y538_9BURK|nr:DUF6691 family protein [Hydromonas duriensis]TDR30183.1 hypothetical protein DFR44_1257 [Hydromonas duriensis]
MHTRSHPAWAIVSAFLIGFLFAVGLVISGMTQPDKVRGFLNVGGIIAPAHFGAWDASLAFVMAGAVLVTLFGFSWWAKRAHRPMLALEFILPRRTDIDAQLITGSVLFGIGWGIAGYCPGPALASILTGGMPVGVFVLAMIASMSITKKTLGTK